MRSEFIISLNYAKAIKPFFENIKNYEHANLMNLETFINFETSFIGWPR